MTRYVYNTATTLDGFLADDADSLDWLLEQDFDWEAEGTMSFATFLPTVGALVMGATTYAWVVEHEVGAGKPWPYQQPAFVFTHRDLEAVAETVSFVAGEPADHRGRIEAAAGDGVVWLVGGGDLAADFARAGMLDEIVVSIAPVTLGSGRRLLGGAFDLRLLEHDRNRAFLTARYELVGPRARQPA